MSEIIIIEDELIIARDLKGILESAGFKICRILSGQEDVEAEIINHNPDIIISDIFIKGNRTGIEIMQRLQEQFPRPLIFITAYSTNDILEEISQIKHDGYIVKPFIESQVIATVKLVANKYNSHKSLKTLTDREKEIAAFLTQGMNSEDISKKLNISLHTVSTHRKNIYKKLNISSIQQLVSMLS